MDRILTLVRARYPMLQLVTHEEDRVGRALERLASEESRSVFRWRATTGLVGPEGSIAATTDLEDALEAFESVCMQEEKLMN